MFESDRVPYWWLPRIQAMDYIIVPSTFNKESFVQAGVARHKMRVLPEIVMTDVRYLQRCVVIRALVALFARR